jgi:hypothetical protein
VARAALQLDETGVNGSSFHAQTGQFRQDERGSRPVQIPGKRCGAPNAATAAFTHTGSFVVADAGLHEQRADSNADSNPTDD